MAGIHLVARPALSEPMPASQQNSRRQNSVWPFGATPIRQRQRQPRQRLACGWGSHLDSGISLPKRPAVCRWWEPQRLPARATFDRHSRYVSCGGDDGQLAPIHPRGPCSEAGRHSASYAGICRSCRFHSRAAPLHPQRSTLGKLPGLLQSRSISPEPSPTGICVSRQHDWSRRRFSPTVSTQ